MEHVPKRKILRQQAKELGVSRMTALRGRGPIHYMNLIVEQFGMEAVEPLLHGNIGRDYWENLLLLAAFNPEDATKQLLVELASLPSRRERHRRIRAALNPILEEAQRELERFTLSHPRRV